MYGSGMWGRPRGYLGAGIGYPYHGFWYPAYGYYGGAYPMYGYYGGYPYPYAPF